MIQESHSWAYIQRKFFIQKHIRTLMFNPWVGKIPWRRERLPTPVFWPGESMDCTVHRAAKSRTRLSDFHFTSP